MVNGTAFNVVNDFATKMIDVVSSTQRRLNIRATLRWIKRIATIVELAINVTTPRIASGKESSYANPAA